MCVYSNGSRGRNQKLKDPYGRDFIFELGLAVPPKNPYFLWRCKTGKPFKVYIPLHLHLEIPNSDLFLIDEKGKKWKTQIFRRKPDARRAQIMLSTTPWGSLCDANNIKIGDVCICEFVQGLYSPHILVRVIRAPAHINTKLEDQHSRDADVFRYGLAVVPNNPYFVWRSIGCQSYFNNLCIPSRFHHKIRNSLFLIDEKGRKWETKIRKGSDKLLCSSVGWRCLCNANHIKLGDICICEFVQGLNGLDILVRVIRISTLTNTKRVGRKKFQKIDKETTYVSESDEDIDEEDGIERVNKYEFPRKSRWKSKDVQYRAIEDQDDIEEEYDIERIEVCNFPQKSGLKSNDATIENQEDLEDEYRIERIDECDLPREWEQRLKDAQQRKIENEDAHIAKFEEIINTIVSTEPNQKRRTLIGSSMKLEQLHSYFNLVHKKRALTMSLNNDVFGHVYKIYMFFKDINNFCLLEPISDSCLISYMCYLQEKMKEQNILDRFRFVNPNSISSMSKTEERVRALVDRLIGVSTNQLVLAPCNIGYHWILTIIDPYNNSVVLLDPLSHRFRDEIWSDVVNEALSRFSASKGKNKIKKPTRVAIKAPLQPDSKQCGFYIMRYMREIIENYRAVGLTSLRSVVEKTNRVGTSSSYSESEIDEVRVEWAEFLLDYTDQQRTRLAHLRN